MILYTKKSKESTKRFSYKRLFFVRTASVKGKGKKLHCKEWVSWRRDNWNSEGMWFLSDGCSKGEGWGSGLKRWEWVKFLTVQVIWLRWNANEKESIDSKRRYSLRWWGKDISRKQENFCCHRKEERNGFRCRSISVCMQKTEEAPIWLMLPQLPFPPSLYSPSSFLRVRVRFLLRMDMEMMK